MALARVNGIELYYEVHGEGPALVLAHGSGGSHLSWWQQVPALARSFRCVTFDHRGFGLSRDRADGPGPRAFVEDLRGLLDHLGLEKAALAGQSMGGWTVLGFAAAYPRRASALVLSDTSAGLDDPDVIQELAALVELTKGGLGQVLTRAYTKDFPIREPARCFLYNQIAGLNTHVPADLLPVLLATRQRAEAVIEAGIPTLLIVGENDELTPPKLMEAMAHRLRARLERVAGSGHSVYFERPEEFNRLLIEFLGATLSSGSRAE